MGIQLRTQEEDLARRKALKGRTAVNGLHYGGLNMSVAAATSGGKRVDEKMVDRDAVLGERVELPGDGIGRERGAGQLL
ncbi:hypothetical protein F1880_002897 [Penicillium rolfsii]|nr:hypothetical protein F1880_002897 [Penicillium rolfsii]